MLYRYLLARQQLVGNCQKHPVNRQHYRPPQHRKQPVGVKRNIQEFLQYSVRQANERISIYKDYTRRNDH